jgi:hypothetical protein
MMGVIHRKVESGEVLADTPKMSAAPPSRGKISQPSQLPVDNSLQSKWAMNPSLDRW